jgi:hypothetical protein
MEKWEVNYNFTDKTEYGAVIWFNGQKPYRVCAISNGNVEEKTNLILSAVNACIEINPEHPEVVADTIKNMYQLAKDVTLGYKTFEDYEQHCPTPHYKQAQLVFNILDKIGVNE